MQAIRNITFVPLICWMADIAAVLLFAGLAKARSENFPSLFFSGISFIVILLLRLIDNFLVCSDINSAEGFSIELLEMAVDRLGPAAE